LHEVVSPTLGLATGQRHIDGIGNQMRCLFGRRKSPSFLFDQTLDLLCDVVDGFSGSAAFSAIGDRTQTAPRLGYRRGSPHQLGFKFLKFGNRRGVVDSFWCL
jgi:hypothetical protein